MLAISRYTKPSIPFLYDRASQKRMTFAFSFFARVASAIFGGERPEKDVEQ